MKFLLTRTPKQITTYCMGKKISHDPVVCLDTAPQRKNNGTLFGHREEQMDGTGKEQL